MFPKQQRFDRKGFDECFKSGQRAHTNGCTIFTCTLPTQKVAVVVPKKACPLAVDRNAIRRGLYHAIKPVIEEQIQPRGYIFIVKKEFIQASKPQRLVMLTEICTRIVKTTVQ